jgi:hypothetical protein
MQSEELDTKSQLIHILSLGESTAMLQRCVSALERTPTIEIHSDTIANTKEIFSIYSLRVEMHRSVIEGGDDLIDALEKEPGEKVRISLVRTDKEEFLIFTDPELKRLIGCISITRE